MPLKLFDGFFVLVEGSNQPTNPNFPKPTAKEFVSVFSFQAMAQKHCLASD
jgi:hypothetical protein